MKHKLIIAILIAMACLITVPLSCATTFHYDTHYEDFNDQTQQPKPENPFDPWYTYTNETFDKTYVDNVSLSAAKVFNVTHVSGDGETINYINFTCVDPQKLDYFEFHFETYAFNKTNKEMILNLSDELGNTIGLFTLHTNQTKMNLSVGDTVGSEATCTVATEYIVNFSVNWLTETVNATIYNLTGALKVGVQADNTTSYLNFTNEPKLNLISLYTDDNSTVFFDNFVLSGISWVSAEVNTSIIGDLANSFVVVLLMLVFWIALIKMLGKVKLF